MFGTPLCVMLSTRFFLRGEIHHRSLSLFRPHSSAAGRCAPARPTAPSVGVAHQVIQGLRSATPTWPGSDPSGGENPGMTDVRPRWEERLFGSLPGA